MMRRVIALLAALAALVALASVQAQAQTESGYVITKPMSEEDVHASLKICGNYCGPSWCAANKIDETSCVSRGLWGRVKANDCTDSCCMDHDKCCSNSATRPKCNDKIVGCLTRNNCGGMCAFAVRNAMKLVGSWCCGSLCPRSLIRQLDAHLNITDLTPDPFMPFLEANPALYAHLM